MTQQREAGKEREAGQAVSGARDAPAAPGSPGGQPRHRRRRRIQIAAAAAVVAAAGAAEAVVATHRSSPSGNVATSVRPTGIPASVSTPTATLMALSPLKTVQAPGFSLVDQNGKRMSLASLRGKVVVLEFMDPHCTDICPIVSKEFVDAYHDLGALNARTAFVAINVNQYHASPAAMAAFSKAHGLDTIPSWQFVTGPLPALKRAWQDYDITVQAPNPNADVVHTSAVYFIDPSGKERYLAMPQVDHTKAGKSYLPTPQVKGWGNGIAEVVRSLAHA